MYIGDVRLELSTGTRTNKAMLFGLDQIECWDGLDLDATRRLHAVLDSLLAEYAEG